MLLKCLREWDRYGRAFSVHIWTRQSKSVGCARLHYDGGGTACAPCSVTYTVHCLSCLAHATLHFSHVARAEGIRGDVQRVAKRVASKGLRLRARLADFTVEVSLQETPRARPLERRVVKLLEYNAQSGRDCQRDPESVLVSYGGPRVSERNTWGACTYTRDKCWPAWACRAPGAARWLASRPRRPRRPRRLGPGRNPVRGRL